MRSADEPGTRTPVDLVTEVILWTEEKGRKEERRKAEVQPKIFERAEGNMF
ncbi:hypothetical protein HanRHA438_Chr15g0711831 [Helianthus annuus]|nr:hypothetical protein HanHA89_Chr15g0619571 [Helianthus annuus]KAJ0630293.1 hypothetical protein HanHA300_Chr00c0336g0746561 [Helianthus annuus]KAJ0649124.1 hypothetical protein HanLR1_Chr15g0580691 [Helianthus annuus]KAJ0652923.1 hypothetical protein HanOQP8_Chr15g0577721 [Helianthus annuus]KAJ0845279.1 hypothetical protein HanRHA438_Chr15g0711831 [Helianthus annuus]